MRYVTQASRLLVRSSEAQAHSPLTTIGFVSPTMGLLLSFPLAGVFGTVASSCLAGLAFCFTSTAGQQRRKL